MSLEGKHTGYSCWLRFGNIPSQSEGLRFVQQHELIINLLLTINHVWLTALPPVGIEPHNGESL